MCTATLLLKINKNNQNVSNVLNTFLSGAIDNQCVMLSGISLWMED